MLIKTQSTSINTMSVTIRALHIENKQMTLAVFKQLPSMEINDDCSIWGIVRYKINFPDDEWLVFSYKEILYKCEFELRDSPPIESQYSESEEGKNFYKKHLIKYEKNKKIKNSYPQLFISV